jgi:hypothetical protein
MEEDEGGPPKRPPDSVATPLTRQPRAWRRGMLLQPRGPHAAYCVSRDPHRASAVPSGWNADPTAIPTGQDAVAATPTDRDAAPASPSERASAPIATPTSVDRSNVAPSAQLDCLLPG